MKFELKMDKEQLVEIGKGAGKIGKTIIMEGTKSVMLKSAEAVITQSFSEGLGSVKSLELDDLLKGGKKKKPKKALFSFKKKQDETEGTFETEVGLDIAADDEVVVEETKVEPKPAQKKTVNVKKTK